jgi:hypothetical protein
MLDRRVKKLKDAESWAEDSVLAFQRCRRFLMTRFPHLPHPFANEVVSQELSRREEQLQRSLHAKRILRDLNDAQRRQLAGLLLDIEEASQYHTRQKLTSKSVRRLAAEGDRRLHVLFRKTLKIRSELSELIEYAKGLHPVLRQGYLRAAERCLEILQELEKPSRRDNLSISEYYRSQKREYPALEDPKQLGIVQLYWFFHESGRSGRDSEVRAAMIANEFLSLKLKYIEKYSDAESMGSSAVRLAVSRYRPRTMK